MRKVVTSAVFLALLASVPAPAMAWVFGLSSGSTGSDLRVVEQISPNVVRFSPPQPNPLFERYLARLSSTGRICRILASGFINHSDSYGSKIRSDYNTVRRALTERYGPSDEFDFIRRGSIWSAPEYFAKSLEAEERNLISFWSAEDGSNLPPGMIGIILEANAVGMTATYLSLSYDFEAIDECDRERSTAQSRGL